MIYLDHHATTPLDPRVLEAMLPFMKNNFGNPSSGTHKFGWDANEAVENAREQVAKAINCDPYQIIFTSGATESNNTILKSFKSITYGVLEHSSIIELCRNQKVLSTNREGFINIEELKGTEQDLITIMYVNNEIGTIQDIKRANELKGKSYLHSDMAQALGKIPINIKEFNVDFASFSAHKIYGPKGIGAIYSKDPDLIVPLIQGGKQEIGLRAGTLNVPAIVGFGKACEIITNELEHIITGLKRKEFILRKYLEKIPNVKLYNFQPKVPGSINAVLPCDIIELFSKLSDKVAFSTTSACMSIHNEPSRVLMAIGLDKEDAKRFIRICVGRFNTLEELKFSAEHIGEAIKG